VSAWTLVQLVEVLVFGAVLLYGVLSLHPSLAVLGGAFLIGKAVLNILAPEGGSVVRRSLIGYGLGGIYALFGIAAVHFLT
jgi:hypothetical protein